MELEVAYVLSNLSLILRVYSFFVDPMDDLNSSSITVLALLQTKVKVVFYCIALIAILGFFCRLFNVKKIKGSSYFLILLSFNLLRLSLISASAK